MVCLKALQRATNTTRASNRKRFACSGLSRANIPLGFHGIQTWAWPERQPGMRARHTMRSVRIDSAATTRRFAANGGRSGALSRHIVDGCVWCVSNDVECNDEEYMCDMGKAVVEVWRRQRVLFKSFGVTVAGKRKPNDAPRHERKRTCYTSTVLVLTRGFRPLGFRV